jgi:hypothetical protein
VNHGISADTVTNLTEQGKSLSQRASDARDRAYELEQKAAEQRTFAARVDARALEWRTLAALATGAEPPRLRRTDAEQLADVFRLGARLLTEHPDLPQPQWTPDPAHLAGSFWGPDAVDHLNAWADALGVEVTDDPILPVRGRQAFKLTANVDGIQVWLRADRPRDADDAPASTTNPPTAPERSAA